MYSWKNEDVAALECEKEVLSDVPGEKYNDKKGKSFWGFLKIYFIPNSAREEVRFYKFYMILNEVVKMYIPCFRNPKPTLKKS